MLSEDALRAGAVTGFTKAQALYHEAKLLDEQAQAPRAAALALMGAEEFAQAVLCTVAALVPAHRHALPCSVSSLPILGKGKQFPRVIGILAPSCSHYKYSLY